MCEGLCGGGRDLHLLERGHDVEGLRAAQLLRDRPRHRTLQPQQPFERRAQLEDGHCVLVHDVEDHVVEGVGREGHRAHGHEQRQPHDGPPRHEAVVRGLLLDFLRVVEEHERHEDRVESEGDDVGREHAHAEEEDVQVRLVQQRQRALAHALPRRRPQLHRAAAPAALLLAVGLVVGRDLVGALHVVAPHELPPS